MKRRSPLTPYELVAAIILLTAALSGCDFFKSLYGPDQDDGTNPPVSTQTVQIVNFSFQPATIHVKAGTTVTWIQKDSAPHTVTSTNPAGLFASANLSQGQQFTFTFSKPGVYEYQCTIHPSMQGTVTVD